MKKTLAVFLILALAVSLCPLGMAEEEPEVVCCGEYDYVVLEDGSVELKYYYAAQEEVVIPDEVDGRKVTGIGDGAFAYSTFFPTSISIPDSVTSIGVNPFQIWENLSDIRVSKDHPYLEMIDGVLFSKPDKRLICYPCALPADSYIIPDGIQIIGGSAFYRCISLTSITIPDSVTKIEANPFIECDNLTDVHISKDHPCLEMIDGILFSKPDKRLIYYPRTLPADSYIIPEGIQIIADGAFLWCEHLTSITIPDSVTSIGERAFSSCIFLASITIPDSVTSIGKESFYYCPSLTVITIPDSVTSIGEGAFYCCYDLTSITIPDSVTSIGENAFSACHSLTVTVSRDSYAEQYCKDNDLKYVYAD